ncbi:MAG: hypothetical protein R3C56_36135 [Pirellulaceae bacterium]
MTTVVAKRANAMWFLANGLCALTFSCLVSASKLGAQTPDGETSAISANSFLIPAFAFDRGNAKTFTTSWADAEPMVACSGESPVVIEYDIDFPVTAEYALSIRYAASDARPVQLFLDGKSAGMGCRTATGTWNTSGAKSESTIELTITQGKHTLKLMRVEAFPHVVSLKFESPIAFPKVGSWFVPMRGKWTARPRCLPTFATRRTGLKSPRCAEESSI